MKVRIKKQEVNNISFASKLWALIDSVGSLSYTDKVKLFDGAVNLSREHVGDCVDAMLMSFYIALHDDHGFGAKRFKQLDEKVQPIIDETVNKYDIATVYTILDRVSCWCCANKNAWELYNIWKYLPQYWERLKKMQSKIDMPMKKLCNKKFGEYGNIFELQKVFESGYVPKHRKKGGE